MFDPSKNLKKSEKFVQSRRKIEDFIASLTKKNSEETLINEFYKWEGKKQILEKKKHEMEKLQVH